MYSYSYSIKAAGGTGRAVVVLIDAGTTQAEWTSGPSKSQRAGVPQRARQRLRRKWTNNVSHRVMAGRDTASDCKGQDCAGSGAWLINVWSS